MQVNSKSHDFTNKFLISGFDPSSESKDFIVPGNLKASTSNNQKELADIIIWVVQFTTTSAEKIKEKFSMGNRAYKITDELFKMGIISEKFSKQSRTVSPNNIENISDEVKELLLSNGYSVDDIIAAFNNRNK